MPSKHTSTIGKTIAAARKKLGLSQTAFAERCGWDQGRLSHYETGRNEPGISELKTLREVLGVNIDQLVDGNIDSSQQRAIDPNLNTYLEVAAEVAATLQFEPKSQDVLSLVQLIRNRIVHDQSLDADEIIDQQIRKNLGNKNSSDLKYQLFKIIAELAEADRVIFLNWYRVRFLPYLNKNRNSPTADETTQRNDAKWITV